MFTYVTPEKSGKEVVVFFEAKLQGFGTKEYYLIEGVSNSKCQKSRDPCSVAIDGTNLPQGEFEMSNQVINLHFTIS